MKQIEKTPAIRALLSASAGDVDLDALRVYEAIAFNTLPIRKQHPLYKGARADRAFLGEMADELKRESRPVQIQHNSDPLPAGRVFYGEVVDTGVDSELRVLFFLDPTADEEAKKIEAGTVDQVSVSVLANKMINSKSGFDYFGPEADLENIWSGSDNDGNTIGRDGVYAKLVGLNKFFEMSLVGMGGAQNARIVSRDRSHFGQSLERLAASGMDPNSLVLLASATPKEKPTMDLKELVASLTATTADLTNAQRDLTDSKAKVTSLEASVAEQATKITDLEAQLSAGSAADAAALTADRDAAVAALSAVTKNVLTKVGKLNVSVPATVAEMSALIDENSAALVIKAGGNSNDRPTDLSDEPARSVASFRLSR